MSLLKTFKFIINHPLNKGRKAKSLLGYLRWQIGSRLVPGEIIYHWVENSKFIVRPGETGLTQNIYCGLHEFDDMAYTLRVLNSDDVFIDIGANVGSYTILACGVRGAKGYCFEPVPSTFNRLMNNIKLNDLSDRVKAYNIGLADKEDVLFFTSGLNTVNHVITETESGIDAIKVKVFPLDNVIADDSPALIKIDVEGLETLVLNGMLQTLENSSLHSVIMELNGSGNRYGFKEENIIKKMRSFDFQMYSYEPFRNMLSPLLRESITPTGNVLFLRNEEFIKQRLDGAPHFKFGSWEI